MILSLFVNCKPDQYSTLVTLLFPLILMARQLNVRDGLGPGPRAGWNNVEERANNVPNDHEEPAHERKWMMILEPEVPSAILTPQNCTVIAENCNAITENCTVITENCTVLQKIALW